VLSALASGISSGLKVLSKCWQCLYLESQRNLKVVATLASEVSKGVQGCLKVLAALASGVSKGSQGGLKVLAVVTGVEAGLFYSPS
jgi:hypothetical protein